VPRTEESRSGAVSLARGFLGDNRGWLARDRRESASNTRSERKQAARSWPKARVFSGLCQRPTSHPRMRPDAPGAGRGPRIVDLPRDFPWLGIMRDSTATEVPPKWEGDCTLDLIKRRTHSRAPKRDTPRNSQGGSGKVRSSKRRRTGRARRTCKGDVLSVIQLSHGPLVFDGNMTPQDDSGEHPGR
jgi:hypothetical protein